MGLKIIELLAWELAAEKFLDGSMGKNKVEAKALILSISETATGRKACVCLCAFAKDPDIERRYKKKSGKTVYSKKAYGKKIKEVPSFPVYPEENEEQA